jgi:two-component system, sensor histidine kinase RegB
MKPMPSPRRRLALMRWWLLGGLVCAVLAAPTFLDIRLPVPLLLAVLLLLAGFNAYSSRQRGSVEPTARELAGQLCVDLVGMGVLFYLTGGVANPLVSLLLLPVAVAALTLPERIAMGVAVLAMGLYSFLMLYSLPLPIADAARATRLHLGGMWLTFVVSALLVAWFIGRIMTAMRVRDAELATAREERMRDAQVVALGQLAAGAAHELGTPLATMSVLAEDLSRDEQLPADVHADLNLLRRQIALCKEILGGLTRRAGNARAGEMPHLPADLWLQGVLARWRSFWPHATCNFAAATQGTAPGICPSAALEQSVTNLLNNAAQADPREIRLELSWSATRLRIAVHDGGPGFPDEILHNAGGVPVAGTGQGAGIGLWLTRSAVERLGGCLRLENAAKGGVAEIDLPLESMQAKEAE